MLLGSGGILYKYSLVSCPTSEEQQGERNTCRHAHRNLLAQADVCTCAPCETLRDNIFPTSEGVCLETGTGETAAEHKLLFQATPFKSYSSKEREVRLRKATKSETAGYLTQLRPFKGEDVSR